MRRGNLISGHAAAISLLAAAGACGLFLQTARAEDTSQVTGPPPEIYTRELAPLLTPLSAVIAKTANLKPDGQDGTVLLDETLTYVESDGRRISVYHFIDKAWNDAGVSSMAQDSISFKKKFQQAHLVLAQTIQPDGSTSPIKKDAIFLKTPQDEADDSVYDDELNLVTIYSDVKPGTMTERIVVIEDAEPKIPGEYTQNYIWSGGWPEFWQRLSVDLPKPLADRLKVTNLGSSVPSPATMPAKANRQRLQWEKFNSPGDPGEDTEAPAGQIGPMVWLSTLKSWDTFAAWYNGLTKGTEVLGPDLKAKIDGWTRNAKSPAEILDILYGHVAQDVRYTGFELGKSDLQPHDCMSVWDRQYGDCKDKANLLRVMLKYKGIDSWLTLLATDHAGTVERDSPDFRQFNHCIVQAQLPSGTIFCDPTIVYGVPGLIGGSEADRDVLVIQGDHADWAHTPPFTNAELDYDFDLQIRPSGDLAGWAEFKATGYYAATYEDSYHTMSKEQVLSHFQDDMRNFYPTANVADVEPMKDPPAAGVSTAAAGPPPFSVRAYMVVPGFLNQSDPSSELKFPAPNFLMPDLKNYNRRRHATYVWSDVEKVHSKIQLPAGWTAKNFPGPFNYDSSQANFQASWAWDKKTLTASCVATIKQSFLPPGPMNDVGAAATNLESWASKSLLLEKAKDGPALAGGAPTDAELAANLEVMPTGEGQLNLIDSEFPSDGNIAARRAALERIPALFPSDKKSIVESSIKIADLDLDDKKWPQVIARLQPIIDANRSGLDLDTISWGNYIIASALLGEDKKDEARALFQKIADNPEVDSGWRGWSIYQTAQIMADKSPPQALDYADAGLNLNSTVLPDLYAFYASTAIKSGNGPRLKDRLTKLISAKPENLEDILMSITDSAQGLVQSGHQPDGLALVTLLESLASPATTGESFAEALKKIRSGAEATASNTKLQQGLKDLIAQFPDLAALERAQPAFASIDDLKKSLGQHDDAGESDASLGCCLRLAIGYPADENFPDYFWKCANYADWAVRNSTALKAEPFFFKLCDLGNGLPHDSDGYADLKFLQAKVLGREGHLKEAAQIFQSMVAEPHLSDGYQGSLALRSGDNWMEQGDYAKALACYKTAEATADYQSFAQEAVLRSFFLQFDLGNKPEANRILHLLAQEVQAGKGKPTEQVRSLADFAQATPDPPAYWDAWHAWWPQWQNIESNAGLDPVKQKVIPVIPSLSDFSKDMDSAEKDRDTKQYFGLLRQLAYAARCSPDAALEFVGRFETAESLLPDYANDLRFLGIAVLKPIQPSGPTEARFRMLHLLVNYVDSGQDGQALATMAKEWTPDLDDESAAAVAIHRVWAIAANRKHRDLDKVEAALQKDLKDSEVQGNEDRDLTINSLVDLYITSNRQQDAVQLLKAELALPAVASDSSAQQALKARLDGLQTASGNTSQLAAGATAWLKDHQPAWWDYAEPQSADDPRMSRLADIIKSDNPEMPDAELVKAGLLSPMSANLPAEDRQAALVHAYHLLLFRLGSQDDAYALAESVIDNPSFPSSLKTTVLFWFLHDAYEHGRSQAFQTYEKLPIYQEMADSPKTTIARLGAFMKLDRTSSPQLTQFVQNLAKQPMDSLDLDLLVADVGYLLDQGDISSAESVLHASANYIIKPDAGSNASVQLGLIKLIDRARILQPTVDALRQVVLKTQQPETPAQLALFEHRRDLIDLDDLTAENATAIRFHLIKTHQEPLELPFWSDFAHDLPIGSATNDLKLALLKAAFESSSDDHTRAFLVRLGAEILDTDNPVLLQQLLALIKPYRDPVKFPETMENIRMVDVQVDLRSGKPMSLENALAGFTSPHNVRIAAFLKLRAYRQDGDLPKLKSTLDDLTADEILEPQYLQETVPALEEAGMSDQATLARGALMKKLHDDVLTVWLRPDADALESVENDITGLGTTSSLPPGFDSFIQSHVARKQSVLGFEIEKAYLDKDWNTVAKLGTTYTHDYPTFYAQYWFLGRSLAELGRNEEASAALRVYCHFAHDEIWYPDASKLLAKVSAPKT